MENDSFWHKCQTQSLKPFLLVLSFLIVAFGQPAWSERLSLLSSLCGYACFWIVLLNISSAKKRFLLGFLWFAAVQAVQLSWFLSHPFYYIYAVWIFCSLWLGVQWGLLSLCIRANDLRRFSHLLAIGGFWVLLEWSRLFFLSGLPFNPIGLTLSGSLYSMQMASIAGVLGMSFLVILTNLSLLKIWLEPRLPLNWIVFSIAALFPYAFGWIHLEIHEHSLSSHPEIVSVLLVQPALPIEENMPFRSAEEARQFVMDEWRHILTHLQNQYGQKIDLIVFPEYLVPYGTFKPVFLLEDVQMLFFELFGDVSHAFPFKNAFFIGLYETARGEEWLVSNAYFAKTLANLFNSHVVIGLEDSQYIDEKKTQSYSSAFHFFPGGEDLPSRYEKRVLVPMGEYIPFKWCRKLALRYGISGAFTAGDCAKVFQGPVPFGASICYEEMYGHLMRENRLQGAQLLVNLTNDGWFPNSSLPKQHFDHSRLRTIENGIPLVRACNTGVTAVVDSLGKIVAILGEGSLTDQERAGSIRVDVPLYHYKTLYSSYGDLPLIAFSCLFILVGLRRLK